MINNLNFFKIVFFLLVKKSYVGIKKNIYIIFFIVCEENIKIDFFGDWVINSVLWLDYI